ncbi:hypothetical protein HWC21_gp061 [Vibrio phage VAP7]|uniref:Uncharacterized protein n=1 Tax=Vibrio phage VAP7 TaxID=2584487 RepID=A0A4Y5TV54_9CAUD|nr:hypothetical protein HWC21_gp061 [Vibrio phage VAP7]QDB73243.1 hypothetical protein [Vibrio phage VAP7]UFD98072.1 hypothetical protein [Vibrio phage BX-1]
MSLKLLVLNQEVKVSTFGVDEVKCYFDEDKDWWFAVDKNGEVWAFDEKPQIYGNDHWDTINSDSCPLGVVQDSTGWENSLAKLEKAPFLEQGLMS